MSDAEWDADDYDPPEATPAAATTAVVADDKWEGEDSDDEVKDNWDDEEEEGDKKDQTTESDAPKKKKSLKEKIAEKEAKRKTELEERRKAEEEARKNLSPEEVAAEKLRQQKIQEDADLELAKEAFGVSDDEPKGVIDAFKPESKEDFENFEEMLKNKILKFEHSPFYPAFIETLFRNLSLNLETDELKKLGSQLTAMSSEKAKQQKAATKGKKKKGGTAKLNAGRDDNYEDYTVGGFDDYDDFI